MKQWWKSPPALWGIGTFVFSNFIGWGLQLSGITSLPVAIILIAMGFFVGIGLCSYAYKKAQNLPQVIELNQSVNKEEAQQIYEATCNLLDREKELSETVSRSKVSDYIKIFNGKSHFEMIRSKQGDIEAVLQELLVSKDNPLLTKLKTEDEIYLALEKNYRSLRRKVSDDKLDNYIETLIEITGERNNYRASAGLRERYAQTLNTTFYTHFNVKAADEIIGKYHIKIRAYVSKLK
jgi:predicted transcriptional regulator